MILEIGPDADRAFAKLRGPLKETLRRALGKLLQNPRHPGLHTHVYKGKRCPHGDALWQSYVTQGAGAYRIWWCYPPDQRDTIYVVELGPHP